MLKAPGTTHLRSYVVMNRFQFCFQFHSATLHLGEVLARHWRRGHYTEAADALTRWLAAFLSRGFRIAIFLDGAPAGSSFHPSTSHLNLTRFCQ
jgi:hypothetical protein